jgi:hypothetical protein
MSKSGRVRLTGKQSTLTMVNGTINNHERGETPIVVEHRGRMYIPITTIILDQWFFVASCDGLDLIVFKEVEVPYIHIDDAIAWVNEECRMNPQYRRNVADGIPGTALLKALRRRKGEFDRGEMPEE